MAIRIEDPQCSICLDSLLSDREICAHKTGQQHPFHRECIETFFAQSRDNPPCPCCRTPISSRAMLPVIVNEPIEETLKRVQRTAIAAEQLQHQYAQEKAQVSNDTKWINIAIRVHVLALVLSVCLSSYFLDLEQSPLATAGIAGCALNFAFVCRQAESYEKRAQTRLQTLATTAEAASKTAERAVQHAQEVYQALQAKLTATHQARLAQEAGVSGGALQSFRRALGF